MTLFSPTGTVKKVIKEAAKLFDYEIQFEREQRLGVLLGDEARVKYILLNLVKKA